MSSMKQFLRVLSLGLVASAASSIAACGSDSAATPSDPASANVSTDESRRNDGGATSNGTPKQSGDGIFGHGTVLHGFKIQCNRDPNSPKLGDDVCLMPFSYQTNSLTYAQAVAQLAANHVDHVLIKICELNNQCKPTATFTEADRNAEVVRLLTAFNDAANPKSPNHIPGYSPHIFLWERQWMLKSDGDIQFADEISGVVLAAAAAKVDGLIDGVGVIEDQLPDTEQVLDKAKTIADRINVDTQSLNPNGWLTTHTFLFPGGGNGTWFDSIDRQPSSATFFDEMQKKAARFSFIYKNFPLQKNCTGSTTDNPLCSKGVVEASVTGYSHDFVDCLENSKKLSKSDGYLGDFDCSTDAGKKSYMLSSNAIGGLGLGDLRSFLTKDCGAHPKMTIVVFWGDNNDAFSQMTAANVRVLHQILVDDRWTVAAGKGCGARAYTLPSSATANQLSHLGIMPIDLLKPTDSLTRVLAVDGNSLVPNTNMAVPAKMTSYTNAMTAYQEWNIWPAPTPATCGTATPCY